MRRHILFVGLILTLALLFSFSATAQSNIAQTVLLTEQGDAVILSAQNPPSFWELPTLKAGETYAKKGTLTLVNNTKTTRTISLDTVKLPYDNETSLRYLNHLILRVAEGERILFNGPYSTINDTNGLLLSRELEAGQSAVFTISLRCDYTCPDEGLAEGEWIDWQFYTTVTETNKPVTERFNDPALLEMAIAIGAAALLLIGALLFDKLRKK